MQTDYQIYYGHEWELSELLKAASKTVQSPYLLIYKSKISIKEH